MALERSDLFHIGKRSQCNLKTELISLFKRQCIKSFDIKEALELIEKQPSEPKPEKTVRIPAKMILTPEDYRVSLVGAAGGFLYGLSYSAISKYPKIEGQPRKSLKLPSIDQAFTWLNLLSGDEYLIALGTMKQSGYQFLRTVCLVDESLNLKDTMCLKQ